MTRLLSPNCLRRYQRLALRSATVILLLFLAPTLLALYLADYIAYSSYKPSKNMTPMQIRIHLVKK